MTIKRDFAIAADRFLVGGDVIRLVNNAFAFCFKEARLSTTGGSDIEHIRYFGQVSTIIRAKTSKEGDLLLHFDRIDETPAETRNTSPKLILVNDHNVAAIKKT